MRTDMGNETIKSILGYADIHGQFSIRDLFAYFQDSGINMSSLKWYLFKLVKKNQLTRIGRGIYDKSARQPFLLEPANEIADVYDMLRTNFPFARFCIYNGGIISPLQHHLLSDGIIYVETERDSAETVFNFLREKKYNAYLRPDKDMIYRYIDLGQRNIFVKNLVSESPVQNVNGIPMPTLEKLLVDILRDPDFFFLQGSESEHIIDNAFSLYAINRNRLFRYAERRKVKEELTSIMENLNIR